MFNLGKSKKKKVNSRIIISGIRKLHSLPWNLNLKVQGMRLEPLTVVSLPQEWSQVKENVIEKRL